MVSCGSEFHSKIICGIEKGNIFTFNFFPPYGFEHFISPVMKGEETGPSILCIYLYYFIISLLHFSPVWERICLGSIIHLPTSSLTETDQVIRRRLYNYVKSKNLVNTYISYKDQLG